VAQRASELIPPTVSLVIDGYGTGVHSPSRDHPPPKATDDGRWTTLGEVGTIPDLSRPIGSPTISSALRIQCANGQPTNGNVHEEAFARHTQRDRRLRN